MLDKGFFVAARKCLWVYDQSRFRTSSDNKAENANSVVDYALLVNNEIMGLCEAKSASVMMNVYRSLPSYGIPLKWVCSQPLVPKLLTNVSTLFPLVTAFVIRRNL